MYSKPLTSNLNGDLLGSHPITTDFEFWSFFSNFKLLFFIFLIDGGIKKKN